MQQDKEYLKSKFISGAKPTQNDFHDLLDSYMHKSELDSALQRLESISMDPDKAWNVDSALDEGSSNPVQNKVVAAKIGSLLTDIAANKDSAAALARSLDDLATLVDGKVEQETYDTLKTAVDELTEAVAKKAEQKEMDDVEARVEAVESGKVDKSQGAAHAGQVLTVGSDGTVAPAEGSADGNTLNVGKPSEGYYTLGSALASVDEKKRKTGLCITWMSGAGTWESKQYCGDSVAGWSDERLWKDYGGGGLSGLEVNGTAVTPDGDGKVALSVVTGVKVNGTAVSKDSGGGVNIAMDTVAVDATLDAGSTNAVSNAAVTERLNEVAGSGVTGVEVESVEGADGGTKYNLVLQRQYGTDLSVELPAGSGSGGSGSTSRISLRATLSATQVKEGDAVTLTYQYDHLNGDGESDGVKADLTVTVKKGGTTTLQRTVKEAAAGSYTLDLSEGLQAGTIDVYVKAEATVTDEESGETKAQSKQVYCNVSVVQIGLSTSYDLAESFGRGGYGSGDTITIPWAVSGSGSKNVTMVVDGDEANALNRTQTISKSGTTNGEMLIDAGKLSAGRHYLQLYAEVGGLRSACLWIDIMKAGGSGAYIGLLTADASGAVSAGPYPALSVGQYEQLTFAWAAYSPDGSSCEVRETSGGTMLSTMSVGRSVQTYANRYNAAGSVSRALETGGASYPLNISVGASRIAVSEAAGSLAVKLSASGRSNSEADPAQWKSGATETAFEGVDWKVSGWDGESLTLKNGAAATIGYKPFESDPGTTGLTIEMEYRLKHITARNGEVISCYSGGKGFRITTDKINLLTGGKKNITDSDTGETIEAPAGVETDCIGGKWLKVAYVIGKRSGTRLMELYVNGVRCSADEYGSGDSFMQEAPVGIRITSDSADVELRMVRAYGRALSDDEELGNYTIDRVSGEEIYRTYDDNDLLDGDTVSMDKLRSKGKGVMRIVRAGGLDEVNSTNDKKAKFYGDVYFYSPWGGDYDYVAKNVLVQIQGTSSTKYPRKNYRITLNKGQTPKLYVGAEAAKEAAVPGSGTCEADKGNAGNLYAMRAGATPVSIFCMKKDFSDSTMTHNTGFAKVINEVMKEMGVLTPAQEADATKRTAIDGFPIDIFSSESAEGESTYYGQYNYNNEKKDSGKVYGFDEISNADGSVALGSALCCLEFLNNSEKLCNWQVDADLDSQLDNEFDNAFEFRYPENDTVWASATEAQKTAVKRLLTFIRDSKPAGAEVATRLQEQGGDDRISTWANASFGAAMESYFDKSNCLGWYILTDYLMAVDQRAKNLMLVTWDGLKWYFIYYDGDTMLGDRNDSYLAYDYLLTRLTWDVERNKYAYEGHGSWLWNLVLANMGSALSEVATRLRGVMSTERVMKMLMEEQMGNWSARAYNKSGYFTYIAPQLEGVDKGGETVKYPYMYALKGTGEVHGRYTVENRFSLMDAKYQCGQYKSDNIDAYVARGSGDAANSMTVVSDEPYYYGYGTNNVTYAIGLEAEAGGSVTLTLTAAFTANDPIRVYGASRMRELDLSGMAGKMTGQWNLNKCVKLKRLLMGVESGTGGSWFVALDACGLIEEIDVTNQLGASTAQGGKELNLGGQGKLKILKAGGTAVTGVVLAEGAPVETLVLPGTVETLRLVSLPKLSMAGLQVESYARVGTLTVSGCPGLAWETIADRCGALQRLRVEVGDTEGDGQDLVRLAARNLQGVDASGNYVSYCALSGTYRLTRFIGEEVKALYPELEIVDPEYTMIEFDDEVSDDKNVSNLDNATGYKYGTDYAVSGHVAKLLARRHRVLSKVTGDGEATVYALHDKDSGKYADAESAERCSGAALDGSEGDVMMYEPGRWYKGINDKLHGKHYACYSSRGKGAMPAAPAATVLTWDALLDGGSVRQNYKILTGKASLAESYGSDSLYAVCHVVTAGYKRVRFPSVPGTGSVGSVLTDAGGNIVDSVRIETLSGGFESGMYVIKEVPEGATDLYFTVEKAAEFDKVVLSDSDKIEDMEPDWVWGEECLVGVAESTIVGSKLRSVMTSVTSAASLSWTDFHYYSTQRKMQQVDYEMHKDVANLFYAKYGRRDSQAQCGPGLNTVNRAMNGTVALGMTDTVNPTGAAIGAWWWKAGATEYDDPVLTSIGNNNVMGYQDWQGDKYEMMDGVTVNDGQVDAKWVISMADGSARKVKGSTANGMWIKQVVHGKYMDVIPTGNIGGSSSTYYCDSYAYKGAIGRVVYRSSNLAYAGGGVSCAGADIDASSSGPSVGSRLAFRGKIVWAASVSAYKLAVEIA